MTAPAEWVWLARIRRPQGRKGEVFADILTDFPEKFSERRRLWLLSAGDAAPGAKCRACANARENPILRTSGVTAALSSAITGARRPAAWAS